MGRNTICETNVATMCAAMLACAFDTQGTQKDRVEFEGISKAVGNKACCVSTTLFPKLRVAKR